MKSSGHGRVVNPKTDRRKMMRVYFSREEYNELYEAMMLTDLSKARGFTENELVAKFALASARMLKQEQEKVNRK